MKIDLATYKQKILTLPYNQDKKPWAEDYFRKYGCVLSSIASAFQIDINQLIDRLIKNDLINDNMVVNARMVIDYLIDSGFTRTRKIFKIFTDRSPTGYHYVSYDEKEKILYTTFLMKPGIYDLEER